MIKNVYNCAEIFHNLLLQSNINANAIIKQTLPGRVECHSPPVGSRDSTCNPETDPPLDEAAHEVIAERTPLDGERVVCRPADRDMDGHGDEHDKGAEGEGSGAGAALAGAGDAAEGDCGRDVQQCVTT